MNFFESVNILTPFRPCDYFFFVRGEEEEEKKKRMGVIAMEIRIRCRRLKCVCEAASMRDSSLCSFNN